MVSFFTYLRQKIHVAFLRIVMFIIVRRLRKEWAIVPRLFPQVKKETITILSRDSGRKIKANLYHPPSSTSSAIQAQSGPKPVLVNYHGSGFIFRSMFGTNHHFCAKIAQDTGIYVIDADYRKAPENRWPAALHDVEDVLNWVSTQPERFNSKRVATSGFSAGGTLALVAAGALRKTLKVSIEAVAVFYPITDLSLPNTEKKVPNPINPFPVSVLNFFNAAYVSDVVSPTNPLVSPVYSSADEFPSTMVVVTAEGDVLSPEAEVFAKKMDEGKRKVMQKRVMGMGHGFDLVCVEGTKEWEAREETYGMVVNALKGALCK